MHYWGPIVETYKYIGKHITKDMKVLELGPGVKPFPYATHFCGWSDSEREKLPNYKVVNFSKDRFPYEDKEFDFVYARHVLEDLYNPFHCMDEMSRIARCGYIECPSPIVEMHYDAESYTEKSTDKMRGYRHHYYFVWNNGPLNFLHKFPCIEHIKLTDENFVRELLKNPINWNTYFIWKDKINYKNHEHPQDYDYPAGEGYMDLIIKSILTTQKVNELFEKEFLKK